MVGAAVLASVAFGLSLAAWRRGIETRYAIAGVFTSGPALLVSVVSLVILAAA